MGGFVAPIAARVDLSLTTYQQRYRNNAFLSDILFPRVPVPLRNAVYPIWGREDQMLDGKDLRSFGDSAEEIRMSYSTDSYNCNDHSRKVKLPIETMAELEQVGMGAIVQSRSALLQDKVLMAKEYAMASLMTTGNIAQNVTLAGPDRWTDNINSNPIQHVNAAKRALRQQGLEATHMIIGENCLAALQVHEGVKEAFKYTVGGSIRLEQLAAYFQIPNVILASAIYIALDGTTIANLWDPEDALICHVRPAMSTEDLSFGKTFVWAGAPATSGGYAVEQWTDPDSSKRTEWMANHFYFDQKITCANAAYLIKDAGKA
jgi:hypothetical protein